MLFTPALASANDTTTPDPIPNVKISEIAWAGSSLSSSDEWIELINLGTNAVDLSGWNLQGALSGGDSYTFEEDTVLEPSHVLLISNYDYAHENCSLAITPSVVTASLSLSNSKLGINLFDDTGALIDSAGDGGAPFAGVSGSTGAAEDGRYRSMVRANLTLDGTLGDAWMHATCQSGLVDGINDYATPGSVGNDVCIEEQAAGEESTQSSDETEEEEPTESVTDPIEPPIIILEEEMTTTTEEETEEPPSEEGLTEVTELLEELYDVTTEETVTEETTENTQEDAEVIVEETIDDATSLFGDLVINEFVSNPLNGEEWIEIINTSSQNIDLTGYTVEDATGKQTALGEEMLAPGAFTIVEKPSGQLNNGGDTIILRDENQIILAELLYGTEELPAPEKGYALARDDGDLFQLTTTLTPGENNVIEINEEAVAEQLAALAAAEETSEADEASKTETTTENDTESTDTTEQRDFPAYSFGDLRINEFVSNPLEGEEWIEIVNASSQNIDLAGCTVEDATGRQTALMEGLLTPGAYTLVVKPSGQLNNGEDTLIIRDGNHTLLDEVTYGTEELPAPEKGYALARDDGDLFQLTTTLTPGENNVIEITEEETAAELPESPVQTSADVSITDEPIVETTTSYDYTKLRLSEIYPNTDGSDAIEEFIEVENVGDSPIDLHDIMIKDASGKTFTVTEQVTLANVAYKTFMRTETGIALNNLGDTVSLFAPDGTLLDELTYEKATQGMALARIDGNWSWTTNRTANETNAFTQTELVQDSGTEQALVESKSTPSTTYTSTTHTNTHPSTQLSVVDAKHLADGNTITIMGTVIAQHGVLGKQFFYLADESGGIQIYKYDADFPAMQEGDRFLITGELSTSRGERRVKATSFSMQNASETLTPTYLLIEEVSESAVGSLVRIDATVVSRSGNTITLEQDGLQQIVRLSSYTDIDTELFARGSEVRVTGILTSSNGELRLVPRSATDIQVLSQQQEEEVPVITATTNTTKTNPALYIGFIALAGLMGLAFRYSLPRLKTYASGRTLSIEA